MGWREDYLKKNIGKTEASIIEPDATKVVSSIAQDTSSYPEDWREKYLRANLGEASQPFIRAPFPGEYTPRTPTKLDKALAPLTFFPRQMAANFMARLAPRFKDETIRQAVERHGKNWVTGYDVMGQLLQTDKVPMINPITGQVGMISTEVPKLIGGTVFDIIDPLTFTGIGAPTKIGKFKALIEDPLKRLVKTKVAKVADKELSLISFAGRSAIPKKVNEVFYKFYDKAEKAIRSNKYYQAFGRRFISQTAHPVTDFLSWKAHNLRKYMTNQWVKTYGLEKRESKKIISKIGISEKELNSRISEVLEKGDSGIKEIDDVAHKLRAINDEVFATERNSIYTAALDGDIEYWLHLLSPEAKKWLHKTSDFPGRAREWNPHHASQLRRKFVKKFKEEDIKSSLIEIDESLKMLKLDTQEMGKAYRSHLSQINKIKQAKSNLSKERASLNRELESLMYVDDELKVTKLEQQIIAVQSKIETADMEITHIKNIIKEDKGEFKRFQKEITNIEKSRRDVVQSVGMPKLNEFGEVEQYTIREANELMRAEGFDGDFFVVDPFVTGAVRADRSSRAISARKFIDETLKFFEDTGEAVKFNANYKVKALEGSGIYLDRKKFSEAISMSKSQSPGIARIKDALKISEEYSSMVDITKLVDEDETGEIAKALLEINKDKNAAYLLPKEIADELNKVRYSMYYGNDALSQIVLKAFDEVQNVGKAWTLSIFPSYHFRNNISNITNNALAGLYDASFYGEAMKLQVLIYEGKGLVSRLPEAERPLIEAAMRRGTVGQGFYGADVPKRVMDELISGNWTDVITPLQRNVFLKGGRAVGTFVENNARLAHFLWKVDEGKKALGHIPNEKEIEIIYDNAAWSVKKYLFDYDELTDFERNVLKRFIPFYTWSRKNIPLQIEGLFHRPGHLGSIEKARINIEKLDKEPKLDEKYVAEFIRENYPIRVSVAPDGTEKYATIAGWLPVGDLMRIVNPVDEVTSMMTPILKEPIQQIANYDFFFRDVIESVPGEMDTFLGLQARKKVIHIMKSVRLLNELDRLFGRTGMGQLDTSERATRYLTGFRLYPQDPLKGFQHYGYEVRKDLDKYKTAMRGYELKYEKKQISETVLNRWRNKLSPKIDELELEYKELGEDYRKFIQSESMKTRTRQAQEKLNIRR